MSGEKSMAPLLAALLLVLAWTAQHAAGSVADVVTDSLFDTFLPQRSVGGCPSTGFYTRDAFLSAATFYGAFGTSGSDTQQRQEIAAFFANIAHETGSGCYIEEINKADYCQPSDQWPCAAGKQYYGRGPIQLSWNYNYGACGEALGFDGIENPEIVAEDPNVSFETALWYWMTQQPTTCHDAMVGGAGFGGTIQAINGGLECGANANEAAQQSRIDLYTSYCSLLGVPTGGNLTC